jgi:hypothetical protein
VAVSETRKSDGMAGVGARSGNVLALKRCVYGGVGFGMSEGCITVWRASGGYWMRRGRYES